MKLSTSKRYSILTLAAVFLIALSTAIGLLVTGLTASASRDITLSGSNYFYTSNDASIEEYSADSSTYYTEFVFTSDSDYVTYRKNLAYNWKLADSDGDGVAENGFFAMTIGFASLSFDTFTIKFQSQQYTLTEDGVTTNYVTFVSDSTNSCVYVIATADEPTDEELNTASADSLAYAYEKITLKFTGYQNGAYTLKISGTATDGSETEDDSYLLENIGSTYSKYVSSSSSNSVIPLTFSASGVSDSSAVEMVLYDLNGQSFELSGSTAGSRTVTDNVAPVLCLDDDFTTVRYGYALELNYAVIDVLATSPRTTINYYVLTNEQANGSINLDVNTEGAGDDDPKVEFVSVSTSDTYAFIDNSDTYKGFTDTADSGYTTKCLVKIYLTIADSTASGGTSEDVYLDWYVEDSSYLVKVNKGTSYESNFIRAVRDTQGASYSYTPVDEDTSTSYDSLGYSLYLEDIMDEDNADSYQYLVNKEATKQEITAGDDNYFYLPSFEGFVSDNLEGYRDLTYSIYYVAGSSTSVSSDTGLAYNELSIELSEEGRYRFVIFATDSESNEMYYWSYEEQEDSSYAWERVTFEADDVSDMLSDAESTLWNYVPYFEFEVTYEGLVVEDPEAQDICYVDNEYTAESFDITGLNSGYSTSYTLYVFDREAYSTDYDTTISYSEMIEQIATLFEDGEMRAKYFTQIIALADLEETDDYYDTYCDYEWDASSLSFIPQDENTFYIIRLVVTDTTVLTAKTTSYMVISSSAAAEELTGESRWAKDNLASIILLSVAGAALIGIILLIVIKPKETADIDVIDMTEEEKKPAKSKKDKKSDK